MTVHITKSFEFMTMISSERYDGLVVNHYTVQLDMSAIADNNREYNVAYGRLKYWFEDVMQDSVLACTTSPIMHHLQGLGNRMLCFPADPVDQLVGIMLHCKLSAIAQQRLLMNQVSVTSPLDDGVIYHHYDDEDIGPFHQSGWWQDSGPNWQQPPRRGSNKVIDLHRSMDWKDLDLDWERSNTAETSVIADFSKHAKD